MERYINRLFVMLIAVSTSLFMASCSNDDDNEIEDGSSTVSNVTLNGVTYTTTEQSHYIVDTNEDALGFVSVLKSDEVEEPIMFALYYPGWDWEDRKITDGKELTGIHIAFKEGAGSIAGYEVALNYTTVESGNVIAVPYDGGHGLEFNNLTFTTSSNPNQTFVLDGTIYYKYNNLTNPLQ